MTVLRDIACNGCQSTDVVAVSPGTEPDQCGLFVLSAGTPLRAWCSRCWPSAQAATERAR